MVTGDDLKIFFRKKKITQEEVAEAFKTTRQTVSNYLKQGVPPAEFVQFAKEQYGFIEPEPKGNAIGIGDLSGGQLLYSRSGNEFMDLGSGQYLMIVPLVEVFAQAGYTAGYSDEQFIEELPRHTIIVTQKHKGTYRAFRVKGDSMDDNSSKAICDGDIATGRMIDKVHWNSRFHLHKYTDYVIVHKEGVIIKTIINHNVEAGIITCQSRNQDKERYSDFEINLKDVYEILNVVAVDRPWS